MQLFVLAASTYPNKNKHLFAEQFLLTHIDRLNQSHKSNTKPLFLQEDVV